MAKINISNWATTAETAEQLGVTPQTLVNWRAGCARNGTRYPPLLKYGVHWVRYKGAALHSPLLLSMSPRELAKLKKQRRHRLKDEEKEKL